MDVLRGGQASQENRTFTANDKWKMTLVERQDDLGAHRSDHFQEADWCNDAADRISLRSRPWQRDISVIVDLDGMPQGRHHTGVQGFRAPCLASRDSG